MIPDIGIMVGLYVITRMLSLLFRKDARAESVAVKIFAVITILATILSLGDLLTRGTPASLQ